ncbi:PREDICTED: uncharacterized protein LOC108560001 [Nicrophorus vespilloides]|uniref:Uncharacterized protein LOC108560001 n=1 Tax=Nicrophorus vespilloides TaxID=110193 RepID=A0ABM1MEA0_NICVS|nr:PREDICTED: uncharacterized protein LOC108560001 [Nicrophorus vespilloides]
MSRINTMFIKLNNFCMGATANCFRFDGIYSKRRAEEKLREIALLNIEHSEDSLEFWNLRIMNENHFWNMLMCICDDMLMLLNNLIKSVQEKIRSIPELLLHVKCLQSMIKDYLLVALDHLIELKNIVTTTGLDWNVCFEELISLLETQDLRQCPVPATISLKKFL